MLIWIIWKKPIKTDCGHWVRHITDPGIYAFGTDSEGGLGEKGRLLLEENGRTQYHFGCHTFV